MSESAPSDAALLGEWLDRRCERAFHDLVARYAGLTHHAAFRVCGDDTLAAEAAQLTFITLARKARALSSRPSLAGWLHVTAVLQTRNLVRQRRRESRKHELLREQMQHEPQETPASAWTRLQPHLDEALAALSSTDRETLLLRFYRSLTVKEVAATLGIATTAAQKRLDRATDRLRVQLARRGCPVGTPLSAAMLGGLGADAQAVFATGAIANQALAAAAATGGASTLTTLGIIVMTKKAAITTGAALLLVGAGAVAVIKLNDKNDPSATAGASVPARSAASGAAPASDSSTAARASRAKERDATKDAELIAKYGESRTNLSKHVATNVIGLLEDAVEMGEMAASGKLGGMMRGGRGEGLRFGLGSLNGKLQLTEEQQTKATELYGEFQKRELEKSKATIEDLKKDPTTLSRLFLAADAYKRGDITEDEYKQLQTANGDQLKGVINPLDRKNFMGGQPLQDDTFSQSFQGLLTPEQTEIFNESAEDRKSQAEQTKNESDITNLPVMELEKLDETVASARKMTSGIKQMMEGMGGLQDLAPLMEQQRKAREGAGGTGAQ